IQLGEVDSWRLHYWTTTIFTIGSCPLYISKHLSHEVSKHRPHVSSIPIIGPSTGTSNISAHRQSEKGND
ncbi:hypothetical protein, partial [Staphylococcus warneri]|uniref:hypothetical protein n=1 Tax=Staphylococcus warneri TaxID=1292 RepID=UPI0030C1D6D5